MRLATRFALACAVTVTVLVLLAGLGLLRLARDDVVGELDATLRAQAARLRPVAVRVLDRPGRPTAPPGLTAPGGVALYGNGGRGGRLWVFAERGQPQRDLDRLHTRVVGTTLVALPVAGLAGWLVGRAATRPLRRLQRRLADL